MRSNKINRVRGGVKHRNTAPHTFDAELRYRKASSATAVIGEQYGPLYEEYFPSVDFKDKSLTTKLHLRSFPQQMGKVEVSAKVIMQDGVKQNKVITAVRREKNGRLDVVKSEKTLLNTSKQPTRFKTDLLITTRNRPFGAKRRFYSVEEMVEVKPVESQIMPPKEQRSDLTEKPGQFSNSIHFSPEQRKRRK